jgi:hypothetical protein
VAKKPRPKATRRTRRRRASSPPRPSKVTPAAVCYFCGAEITPDDRVRQFHELMVHETCYQRDVSR